MIAGVVIEFFIKLHSMNDQKIVENYAFFHFVATNKCIASNSGV